MDKRYPRRTPARRERPPWADFRRTAALGVACLLLPASAFAQEADRTRQLQQLERQRELDQFNLDRRLRANEQVPVGQRALVDLGGFVSFNYLTVRDGDGENRGARIYEAVGYGRFNLDGVHEGFFRGRYTYFEFNSENDSFDGRGSRENDDKIDRLFYRFDFARALQAYEGRTSDSGLAIQGGRDLVYWANGLTLGQRLDGILIDAYAGRWSMQLVAGVTPEHTVDIDASRPDYDTDTRRGFYGAIFTFDARQHQPFAYVLIQRDYNDSGPFNQNLGTVSDFDPDTFLPIPGSERPITTRFGYDSEYWGFGSSGNLSDRLLYSVEAVYQSGSARPTNVRPEGAAIVLADDGRQKKERISAGAVNARFEYLVLDERQTRFSFEQTLASGDRNRIASTSDTVFGNVPGSKDNAFNGFGLINTGLAFAPDLANLSITRFGITTKPLPQYEITRRLQVGLDVFLYAKIQKEAIIDEPTSSDGRFLGWEPDIYLTWQMASDVTLVLRYGYFFPSDRFPDGNDGSRHFFFGGITYAF